MRSSQKDYFPGALEAFGTDLASVDATAVLGVAPTPAMARTLSRAKIVSALRRGGRQRHLEERAATIQQVLRREQLAQAPILENAYGITTSATVAIIVQLNESLGELEAALSEHFEQHPDAKIIHSLPGMGTVLGARVLGEFGDDPNRYSDAKSRRNYAGTSPITRAWCSLATQETSDWPTHSINGRSARRTGHRALGLTTTSCALATSITAKPFASWRIDGSGSCTRASSAVASTTKRSPGRRRKNSPLDKLGARGVSDWRLERWSG